MTTPTSLPEGLIKEKLQTLRDSGAAARKRAGWILVVTAGVLVAGGYVFFSASQIVASDQTRLVEEQLKKLNVLNEQTEKARAAAVAAQQEAEQARRRTEESEMRARLLQASIEATRLQAEKAIEELKRAQTAPKK